MNGLQKERIALLRAEGKSYTKIADTLGLSINTVKSYCRRNNLGGNATIMSDSVDGTFCCQCGVPLNQTIGKKQTVLFGQMPYGVVECPSRRR